jgi:hypothetical protein
MKRLTNAQKRIIELEDALMNLLEVQITPSTPMVDEWDVALKHARRVMRNKVIKGWHRAPPIDTYELRDDFRVEMGPEYIIDD